MTAPALIIMAAGIGSRYGGLKQVEPIGPNGEIVIDYAIYDALRAGFGKVVFVIRRDIEAIFRERIGKKIEPRVDTVYVYQDLENLPSGFRLPEGRTKPWGTGHAVLSCKGAVDTPFAVINADDFYGAHSFSVLARHLSAAADQPGLYDYSMVGYVLRNTLSEHGTVARGVCEVTADGCLAAVQELTRIQQMGSDICYMDDGGTWQAVDANSIVSLNMWGFTPSLFDELEARFPAFLARSAENILKAEFFLPTVVNELLREQKATVRVLPTDDKWYGVTYPNDRPVVQAAIRSMVDSGQYPPNLWNKTRTQSA